MAKELTKKQQVFVAEYLVDLNATRAAIAAGYSKHSAEITGCKLLRNAKVSEQISKKTAKRFEKLEITADRVLQEIAKLAFLDPRKFYDENGNLKPVTELDDETAACLASVEVFEEFAGRGDEREKIGQTKKVRFADKGMNLERLGKHLKLFTDKVEHSGKLTLEDLLAHD
jgi:phage terminase small subunit